MLAEVHPAQRERVHLGPSLASTAGSSVSVASRTKTTESMIPSAIERKAGLGTSSTAERSAPSAQRKDRLAGVSIVTATASRTSRAEPK